MGCKWGNNYLGVKQIHEQKCGIFKACSTDNILLIMRNIHKLNTFGRISPGDKGPKHEQAKVNSWVFANVHVLGTKVNEH